MWHTHLYLVILPYLKHIDSLLFKSKFEADLRYLKGKKV